MINTNHTDNTDHTNRRIGKIKDLITNEVKAGRIFSVSWTKNNGERTTRTFTNKTYIPKGKGNNKKLHQLSLTETIKSDREGEKDKDKWSTVNLNTVDRIKARGKEYRF